MKCAQHNGSDAVGACNSCGRGLCSECVGTFTPPLCPTCVLSHNSGVATSLRWQLALMGGLFVVTFALLVSTLPFLSAFGYSLMAAFFPSGWNFLGRYFSPSGGYIFPMARWINLILHAALASLFGVILGPVYLYKAWKEFSVVRETASLTQVSNTDVS